MIPPCSLPASGCLRALILMFLNQVGNRKLVPLSGLSLVYLNFDPTQTIFRPDRPAEKHAAVRGLVLTARTAPQPSNTRAHAADTVQAETVQSSENAHPASPECKAYRRAAKAPPRFDTTFVGGLLIASGVLSRKTEQTLQALTPIRLPRSHVIIVLRPTAASSLILLCPTAIFLMRFWAP